MKVPPKGREIRAAEPAAGLRQGLNESPSEKEGKLEAADFDPWVPAASLNESPSQRKGNSTSHSASCSSVLASMKALPRRKGNFYPRRYRAAGRSLNESPSQMEGRCESLVQSEDGGAASMKALPKRKGEIHHPRPSYIPEQTPQRKPLRKGREISPTAHQ